MADDTTRCDGGRRPPPDEREAPGAASGDVPTVAATEGAALGDEPALPESIGRFRILSKLGEGGMGVVYEAEQTQPKRRVALKVVRGGRFVDQQSIRLFEREANSLARLKHPNIAAIYESGCTGTGQHYFAMELVRGVTLGHYLRDRREAITPSELILRLRLFLKICDAVQYAHQRGVIHRDLKPGNIVVGGTAGPGEGAAANSPLPDVKILDFGLARITDADMAAATMVSEIGVIKGTLRYMSPEQARGNPEEIDVRSDVYALGIMLYEALTGAVPYDVQRSSLVEALRVICEAAPKPLRQAWTGTRRLDGDLETIVGKAIEKHVDRRYANAAALSDDIARYLASQPILARPPSTVYQLRKLVARNRLATAFAASVAALTVGFGIWMSVLYAHAESNLRRALAAEEEATLEARTAKEVVDFMVDLFAVSDPSEARGSTITAREILDRGAEQIRDKLGDQPRLQSRLMESMGLVYRNLGLLSRALPLLEEAVERRRALPGGANADLAAGINSLAALYFKLRRYDDAAPLAEEALAIQERTLSPDDPEIARTLNNLGGLAVRRHDYPRGRDLFERALAIYVAAHGPDDEKVATALGNLSVVHAELGETALARERLERAIAIRERLGPDDPRLASLYQKLAVQLEAAGEIDRALDAARRSLDVQRKVLDDAHPDLAQTWTVLGKIQLRRGRAADGASALAAAVEILTANFGTAAPATVETRGLLIEALRAQITALEGRDGPDAPALARPLRDLAAALREAGRDGEARLALARADAIGAAGP